MRETDGVASARTPVGAGPTGPGALVSRLPRGAFAGIVLVAGGLAAYRYTLGSLLADLQLSTPLAYLPLLPLFSGYLAILAARRHGRAQAPNRERFIDLLVGLPLLVVAILLITALPVVSSTYYWTDRPDVLSLSLFMIGAVAVLFGLTWVWRLRWPLAFLMLMWPGLYLHMLGGILGWFSTTTNAALAATVLHLPIGVHAATTGGVLLVEHAGHAPVSVAVSSACAGSDSVLGYLLVGGAILTTRSGRVAGRLAWLTTGMVLAFALNLLRITSILIIAATGHASFALEGYHAVIGLTLFTGLVGVMVTVLPHFGLTVSDSAPHPKAAAPRIVTAAAPVVAPRPLTAPGSARVTWTMRGDDGRPSPRPVFHWTHANGPRIPYPLAPARSGAPLPAASAGGPIPAVPTTADAPVESGGPARASTSRRSRGRAQRPHWLAAGLVAALTMVIGLADGQLAPYAAFADGSGAPTVAAFTGVLPTGWHDVPVATYPWASQYFGAGTNWTRYLVVSPGGADIYADVVQTPDQSALAAYNIESCFVFHHFHVLTDQRIALGSGVTGLLLDYSTTGPVGHWSSVSWAWPVRTAEGTRYERIVLTVAAGSALAVQPSSVPSVPHAPGLLNRGVLAAVNTFSSRGNVSAVPAAYRLANGGLESVGQALVTISVPRTTHIAAAGAR